MTAQHFDSTKYGSVLKNLSYSLHLTVNHLLSLHTTPQDLVLHLFSFNSNLVQGFYSIMVSVCKKKSTCWSFLTNMFIWHMECPCMGKWPSGEAVKRIIVRKTQWQLSVPLNSISVVLIFLGYLNKILIPKYIGKYWREKNEMKCQTYFEIEKLYDI